MDKVNSLNREMLRLMREVFNSVEPSAEELEMLESRKTVFKARALLRQLRRDGWTVSPPLPGMLQAASAEGDASGVAAPGGRNSPDRCGGCFAPESTFRLWHCPECRRDLCVGCLRRSQCTRCIKDRPEWDGPQGGLPRRLRLAPTESASGGDEYEEIKVGGTA